jgi:hypothetical protein
MTGFLPQDTHVICGILVLSCVFFNDYSVFAVPRIKTIYQGLIALSLLIRYGDFISCIMLHAVLTVVSSGTILACSVAKMPARI